jgi:hypothetical protein
VPAAGNHAVVAMLARDTWSKDHRTRKSRQSLSYAGGRDARHALGAARRQVKKGIYERAYKELSKKATPASP